MKRAFSTAFVTAFIALTVTAAVASPMSRTVIIYDDPFYWDPSLGWGVGWYGAYGPPYVAVYPMGVRMPKGLIPVQFHVHPWTASVIVDRSTVGEARDYNDDTHPLWLPPGRHTVELESAGYRTLRFELDVAKGDTRSLHYRLEKGEGPDPRSMAAESTGQVQTPRPS